MYNEKECKDFLNIISSVELTKEEKSLLKKFGAENKLIEKLLLKIKTNITNKMLTEDISPDFVKGAIYTLLFIRGSIK